MLAMIRRPIAAAFAQIGEGSLTCITLRLTLLNTKY